MNNQTRYDWRLTALLCTTLCSMATHSGPPPNDLFANRIVAAGVRSRIEGTTVDASREPGEPALPGNSVGQTVWWSWTAPANGSLRLSNPESDRNTAIAVFTGPGPTELELLASNHTTWVHVWLGPEVRVRDFLDAEVRSGLEYHVAVDWHRHVPAGTAVPPDLTPIPVGDDEIPGSVPDAAATIPVGGLFAIDLSFVAAPSNDDFAQRETLTGKAVGLEVDCRGASREPSEPEGLQRSLWWSWTAPRPGLVTLGFTPTRPKPAPSQSTVLAAFPQPTYDDPRGWPAGVVIPIRAEPGGNGSAASDFMVVVVSTSPHPAITEWSELAPAPPFTPAFSVWQGTALGGLDLIAAGDAQATASFRAVRGQSYEIAFGSRTVTGGSTNLHLLLTNPENDDFAERLPIIGVEATASGHTVGTSGEDGEPNHGSNATDRSVWWTWTAPDDGIAALAATATGPAPVLAVYSGASLGTLQRLLGTERSEQSLTRRVAKGEVWQIAIAGRGGADNTETGEGDYALILKLEPLPPEISGAARRQADGSYFFRVDHLRGRGVLIFASEDARSWKAIWAGVVNADSAVFRDLTAAAAPTRFYVVRLALASEAEWFIRPPATAGGSTRLLEAPENQTGRRRGYEVP